MYALVSVKTHCIYSCFSGASETPDISNVTFFSQRPFEACYQVEILFTNTSHKIRMTHEVLTRYFNVNYVFELLNQNMKVKRVNRVRIDF